MKDIQPLTEGRMSKGGHNPPLPPGSPRPPAPGANGNTAAANARKAIDICKGWAERETNMSELKVYPPGTPVEIGVGSDRIRADVCQVCIASINVQYQVVWWDGRTRHLEWVNNHEVMPLDKSKKLPVGFA